MKRKSFDPRHQVAFPVKRDVCYGIFIIDMGTFVETQSFQKRMRATECIKILFCFLKQKLLKVSKLFHLLLLIAYVRLEFAFNLFQLLGLVNIIHHVLDPSKAYYSRNIGFIKETHTLLL